VGTRCANHVTPLYPQKLALTSPNGGGRSVGMVRSRNKATEFMSFYIHIYINIYIYIYFQYQCAVFGSKSKFVLVRKEDVTELDYYVIKTSHDGKVTE